MAEKKENFLSAFSNGAYSGLMIGVKNIIPNLIFAYAIMEFLNITHLMDYVEIIFRPIMMLFGLPGVAAPSLLMGFLTTSGGLGIVTNLVTNGLLDAKQVAMLLVGNLCLGASIQYIGRVLTVAGIRTKFYPVLMIINVINAFVGMAIMRIIL
ncbi:MAG: nucleoside recognition domain-containing protein [Lachnospiraceae bacterium]